MSRIDNHAGDGLAQVGVDVASQNVGGELHVGAHQLLRAEAERVLERGAHCVMAVGRDIDAARLSNAIAS